MTDIPALVTIPAPPPPRFTARSVGTWAATLVALVLGATMVLPALFGAQRYVITGGSMSGTYDRGSVVIDQVVPTRSLQSGDVITFRPPPAAGVRGLVTHRIHAIRTANGVRVYRTKGDANAAPDPWELTLPGRRQAKVAFAVPFAGYLIAALDVRWIRIVLIGLPALLIALVTLSGLWRDAGNGAARKPVAAGIPSSSSN